MNHIARIVAIHLLATIERLRKHTPDAERLHFDVTVMVRCLNSSNEQLLNKACIDCAKSIDEEASTTPPAQPYNRIRSANSLLSSANLWLLRAIVEKNDRAEQAEMLNAAAGMIGRAEIGLDLHEIRVAQMIKQGKTFAPVCQSSL